MTEQSVASPVQDATMPGELIYEYTVQFTGVTSYGAPDLGTLLSGAVESPPQGARYDVAFEGPVVGQKLRGTVKGSITSTSDPMVGASCIFTQRSRPRTARRLRSRQMALPSSRTDHRLATSART